MALRFGFGLACAALMVLVRKLIDPIAPGAGPYALAYPAVMLATLYGRLRAGLLTFAICFAYAWFVLVPLAGVSTHGPTEVSRLIVNALSALVLIVFAEGFRRAVNEATAQRDAEIERRSMMFDELLHRTKNNFTVVASLLGAQKRETNDPDVRQAFDQAIGRVHSFASAYQQLLEEEHTDSALDMSQYLSRLVDTVSPSLFPTNVQVTHRLSPLTLPNARAVAMGLIVNEALTNAAKYAFVDGRDGAVEVALEGGEDDWSLSIADDGRGAESAPPPGAGERLGTGSRLMQGLAKQAKGVLSIDDRSTGYRVTLRAAA